MHSQRFLALLVVTALAACFALDCTVTPAHAARGGARAFSFGTNQTGRGGGSGRTGLGIATGITSVATPIVATNLAGQTPAQVSAGVWHSLLLTDDGNVFSFGDSREGLTGLGASIGSTLVATPINANNLAGKTITQVAAAREHNLLLADDGSVFSFGSNALGRTGLGAASGSTLIATPIDGTNLVGKTITQVATGVEHSLLLADDGSVFAFGQNANGRTGLGTSVGNTLIATPIDMTNVAAKSITQIAAGFAHSLLLSEDGTVFSFGTNFEGWAGLGTSVGNTLVATPIDTRYLAGKSITQIATGNQHSLLLADDGSVFAFGSNRNGSTGLGTSFGSTFVATPIDTTNLAGKTITQIAAGGEHSLLLADDGSVFSFGSNGSGRTGLGSDNGNTLIATPIDVTNLGGLRVIDISAGNEHSLLIAVPEPFSIALAAPALLALFGLRRRREPTTRAA